MKTQTISKKKIKTLSSNNGKDKIPPLENGDRLSRADFERRYEAMSNVKAELIEGLVYMSSPVRLKQHGEPSGEIITWIGVYSANTKGTKFADNSTVRLDLDNEPQPDAILYIKEEFGGNSYISTDDYLEGSPELVVEIAASTVSRDANEKKKVYRRNGVQEYILWRVYDEEIDWFVLEEDKYISLEKDRNGIIESQLFSGLKLNVDAMLEGDLQKVLSDLQKGLKSKKHKNFVKSLVK